jgi:hypothetical protein
MELTPEEAIERRVAPTFTIVLRKSSEKEGWKITSSEREKTRRLSSVAGLA